MFKKLFRRQPPLRKYLSQSEIAGVDALLRRVTLATSQHAGLTTSEIAEVSEGHKALSKLFYKGV